MAKESTPRPHVPPEQKSVNARRQVREQPGQDGGGEEDFASVDPSDEPAQSPDLEDQGPVFDAAEAPSLHSTAAMMIPKPRERMGTRLKYITSPRADAL